MSAYRTPVMDTRRRVDRLARAGDPHSEVVGEHIHAVQVKQHISLCRGDGQRDATLPVLDEPLRGHAIEAQHLRCSTGIAPERVHFLARGYRLAQCGRLELDRVLMQLFDLLGHTAAVRLDLRVRTGRTEHGSEESQGGRSGNAGAEHVSIWFSGYRPAKVRDPPILWPVKGVNLGYMDMSGSQGTSSEMNGLPLIHHCDVRCAHNADRPVGRCGGVARNDMPAGLQAACSLQPRANTSTHKAAAPKHRPKRKRSKRLVWAWRIIGRSSGSRPRCGSARAAYRTCGGCAA